MLESTAENGPRYWMASPQTFRIPQDMQALRNFFWFVLRYFEQGDGDYSYKPLYRTILIVVGILFGFLCAVTVYLTAGTDGLGFMIPVVVFSSVAAVCLIVGLLGSDRAVSRIWGQDK
jgi:hypothetical protein